MSFMNWIIDDLNAASDFFYSIYLEVLDWVWPFWLAADFFYSLSRRFSWLAWDFSDFAEWVYDVWDRVLDILDWGDIRGLIRSWLDGIEDLVNWWDRWWIWVGQEIDDWWSSTRITVLDWISDLESWTQTQLNNLRDTVLLLISDIESWTLTQINSVRSAILTIISDLEAWTITEFNTVRDWILTLISDVSSWTITQIDNVKSAILAIVGNLELWTRAEIDTIMALLSALIDWDALTAWITTWWNNRVTDIQGLIDSAFTLRESLWAGWQDWRDSVAEFFADPLEWLYTKMDEFFERFW